MRRAIAELGGHIRPPPLSLAWWPQPGRETPHRIGRKCPCRATMPQPPRSAAEPGRSGASRLYRRNTSLAAMARLVRTQSSHQKAHGCSRWSFCCSTEVCDVRVAVALNLRTRRLANALSKMTNGSSETSKYAPNSMAWLAKSIALAGEEALRERSFELEPVSRRQQGFASRITRYVTPGLRVVMDRHLRVRRPGLRGCHRRRARTARPRRWR